MKDVIVHKYGGSSLSTPEKILKIARRLGQLYDQGVSLVVVVSAMGKATDQLIDLAHQVSKTPARREMDMLLSTGERVSMSLMSIALQSLNYPAISFTGSQSGILTTNAHNKARIIDIKPQRIEQALKQNQIVIVAGFQGVDPQTKEITTLGRGGSDTTAVTLATYFKALSCHTLKDVDGVCSIDPKVCPQSRCLESISFASLKSMCFWGAPILHYRSVALAQKMNIPLFIGHSIENTKGTKVNHEVNRMYEQTDILAINCITKVIHLRIDCESTSAGYSHFQQFLKDQNLATPQILASAFTPKEGLRIMLTDSEESLLVIESKIKQQGCLLKQKIQPLNGEENAIVSMTFNGAVDHDLIPIATASLSHAGVEVSKVISSPLTIAFVVKKPHLKKASLTLHQFVKK